MSNTQKPNVPTYESLVVKLEVWFDNSFSELPKEIQKLIIYEAYYFGLWDELNSDERRIVAAQRDYEKNPETQVEQEKEYKKGFFETEEKVNIQNASKLQSIKREKEREGRAKKREKQSTDAHMKKIASKHRCKGRKVSDKELLDLLDRKPEHIGESYRASWVKAQLALKDIDISTKQLRARIRALPE